jgi:hypothetical protein
MVRVVRAPFGSPPYGQKRAVERRQFCRNFLTLWKDADSNIPILMAVKAGALCPMLSSVCGGR